MYPIFVRLARRGRAPAGDTRDIAAELSAAGQLVFEHAYFRQRGDRAEGVVFVLSDSAADALNAVRDGMASLIETMADQQWVVEACEIDLLHVNALWSSG